MAEKPLATRQKSPLNSTAISNSIGDAAQVTLLLSDWKNFGLSERVCYHLDLMAALKSTSEAVPEELEEEPTSTPDSLCGVASLLECVPFVSWKDLTKHQRKTFRNKCKDFNLQATWARENPSKPYYQPPHLPIRLTQATRVSFAYEMTRMALVLDASPTLVSAFGASDSDEHLCAMDRVAGMIQKFLEALAEPIPTSYTTRDKVEFWTPGLALTVLAVYPHGGKKDENNTSILVRDFRIHNKRDAQLVAEKVNEWALSQVETTIAKRLNSPGVGLLGYDSWAIPKYTSSLRDLLDAGDVALDFLPARARPCIVLATDCRSVSCEEILDLFNYEERVDVPIHVLDLSSPSWHHPTQDSTIKRDEDDSNFLVIDPGGPTAFPLHMADDSEALFAIARATAGSFFTSELLELASTTVVGQVPIGSPLAMDQFLVIKRRALRPNAVQWYILFSVSPLTQSTMPAFPHSLIHPAGNLVPPEHVLRNTGLPLVHQRSTTVDEFIDNRSTSVSSAPANSVPSTPDVVSGLPGESRRPPKRTTFSTYMVNPVHIKGLLVARAKEGYRAKKFGTSTHDSDKISIQLTFPIEHGTVVHYELQYKALDPRKPLIGVAHVKVEVYGNRNFVQKMKNEFLSYTSGRNGEASRLVKVVWWLRREDLMQSFLCPVTWGEKALSTSSPVVRRLGSLSRLQRMRNYRVDRFDVICTGRNQSANSRYEVLPFSDILDVDNGEHDLFEALSKWSTHVIEDKSKYVRYIPTLDNTTDYCIMHVSQSPMASRLFSITVNTIGGCDIQYRLMVIADLKNSLRGLRDVTVLAKRMYESLVGVPALFRKPSHLDWRSHFLENHFEREEWRPVKDPELLDLVMRRRREIGKFFLLHSTDTYAFFAKDLSVETGKATANPLDDVHLVTYQIELKGDSRQPVVNMHVEKEVGLFSTDTEKGIADHLTPAHRLFMRIKRRDQECSVALRSRTNLLSLFSDGGLARAPDQKLQEDVERLLAYSYSHSRKLRFFLNFSTANTELEMLTVDLILSVQLVGNIVKLDIDPSTTVGIQKPGHWFFVRFDHYTHSLVHLPLIEKTSVDDGVTHAYRELTFFTFGISDLYCIRNESGDDESSNGHVSEYMAVEEFADKLEAVHKDNYAEAAYLALRNPRRQDEHFSKQDFDLVLDACVFTKVVELFVSEEYVSLDNHAEQSKLMTTVAGLLTAVPGDDYLMFYSHTTTSHTTSPLHKRNIDIAEFDGDGSFDDDISSDESQGMDTSNGVATTLESGGRGTSKAVPPVFIRFSLDGENVPHRHLAPVGKGAQLSVYMSVFKMNCKEGQRCGPLPQLHTTVAMEIDNALKSYVAEQTLERLRVRGTSITEADLGTVRKCLRKARDMIVSFIDVHFYVGKSDKMVSASNQGSIESEIEAGFKLLLQQLESNSDFQLRPTRNDSFYVVETTEDGVQLKYWGFITIEKSLGLITVEVYHPEGLKNASAILGALQLFVGRICHRTNQLLLLGKLHQTRNASLYLIDVPGQPVRDGSFKAGHFSCPVVFEQRYELYHRCSGPKVIASLISTTLHSFAVSNRARHFVYKDEMMGIFYLSLEASENQSPENVTLLVHGVQEPGASVTVQLTRLLRKKILLLAVEAWSAVLNKNPHFSWKKADLEFLHNFHSQWSKDDDETAAIPADSREYFFELPESVYDPVSVLIYFRQNICGSTFFHKLNEAINDGPDPSDESRLSLRKYDNGADIDFDKKEFVFFYNNAPSPLDPNFQALSTLTSKGKQLSERTGTGIAIIEMSLVKEGEESESSTFRIGCLPPPSISRLTTSLELVRVKERELSDPSSNADRTPTGSKYLVGIRISDTALNRESLKEWLHLILNQVVASWLIERHIQRSSTGLLQPYVTTESSQEHSQLSNEGRNRHLMEIDRLSPGLPELIDMLQSSAELPHPAIKVEEFRAVMASSSLASHTAGLLDCISKCLSTERSTKLSVSSLLTKTLVIRSSRGDRPKIATLFSKTELQGSDSTDSTEICELTKHVVGDSPIDCPEYLCYFCFEKYSGADSEGMEDKVPTIFPDVAIGNRVSDKRPSLFSQRLIELKKTLPSAFQRSFAFVLSSKRKGRELTMYNWDPLLVTTVLSKVKELESVRVSEIGTKVRSNQRRCLGDLAPFLHQPSVGQRKAVSGKADPSEAPADTSLRGPINHRVEPSAILGPAKRIQRPISIRRPKLVGKSVEGGAMQAMAASRAKARANAKGPT